MDQARAYWNEATARAQSPDALESLGLTALQLGDSASALVALKQAAEAEWRPAAQPGYYREWAEAARTVGAWNDAATAFAAVLARDPTNLTVRLELAQALAAAGRPPEALAEAKIVLDARPNNAAARALVNELSTP